MAPFRPSNLTRWTAPERKRVGIRVTLIQLVLRLFLANVRSQEKWEWTNMTRAGQITGHQRLPCPQRPVPTTTSGVKVSHSTDGHCSGPTERRTTAGLRVCNIDARRSHTVKADGQCFPNIELFTFPSPSCCFCLHSPWSRFKRSTMCLYIFSI